MDLIYTDSNLNDIAVLKDWQIDLAFGSDENNFELQIATGNSAVSDLQIGCFIYMTGTGYGGVVDSKEVKTASNKVYICGRSLEGIMAKAVIMPPSGASYYALNGDCNTIIDELIAYCGLSDIFIANSKKCGTEISNYLLRYNTLYEGLCAALLSVNKKMQIEPVEVDGATKFKISAVNIIDFSQSEEWNSDNINVDVTQYFQQVNHLICLGSGNLADRHVIHLFCDNVGNVQAYATTDSPVKDSDYILDQTNKKLTGQAEVTEVYDYANIENVENYILLTEEPEDWADQTQFYTKDGDTYETLDFNYLTRYTLQVAQPSDWTTAYNNYYYIDSSGSYSAVPASFTYTLQSARPSDWTTNWTAYYTKYDDGAGNISYNSVEGNTLYNYVVQVNEPSDWSSNYTSYYSNPYGQAVEAAAIPVEASNTAEAVAANKKSNIYKNFNFDNLREYIFGIEYATNVANLQEVKYWMEQVTNSYDYTVFNTNIAIDTLISYIDAAQTAANAYASKQSTSNFKSLDAAVTKVNDYISTTGAFCLFEIPANKKSITIWVSKINFSRWIPYQYKWTWYTAPTWEPNKYYTRYPYKVAPAWTLNKYYTRSVVAPTWTIGTYYTNYVSQELHDFVADTYYRLYTDHYYNLVQAGIVKLAELRSQDTIQATIESANTYDVGDIIAINDGTTSINISQRVSKKIVSASDNEIKIQYTLGG